MIFVIEDNDIIVGTVTALIEHKLHHTYMGHIEDVAVRPEYRHKKYGKLLVEHAINYCLEKRHCYKVVLSCRQELIPFYSTNGCVPRGVCMTRYADTN